MPRYHYTPLDTRKKELRLVYLLPAPRNDDAITLNIVQASFQEAVKLQYEALSYTWGSEDDPQSLIVRPRPRSSNSSNKNALKRFWRKERNRKLDDAQSLPNNGPSDVPDDTLPVTQNLAVALHHLRLPEKPRLFWIDAICIDQENVQERSMEVSRMGEIYQKASQVIVWLGPKSSDSDLAMDTLLLLSQRLELFDERSNLILFRYGPNMPYPLSGDSAEELAARRAAVPALLQRPWFSRLWIWQELILAVKVVIICGFYKMPWYHFRRGLNIIMGGTNGGEALHSCLEKKLQDHIFRMITFRTSEPLNTVLDYTKHCLCKDPRDRIYGILSLLPKPFHLDLRPDYSTSPEEVYMNACLLNFQNPDGFELLTFCEMPYHSWKRSWVPDLSSPRLTKSINYASASGFSRPEFRAVEDKLLVNGIYVDRVSYVSSSISLDANLGEIMASIRGWVSDFDGVGLELRSPDMVHAFVCTMLTCQFTVEDVRSENFETIGESLGDFRTFIGTDPGELPKALIQGPFIQTVITTLPGRKVFRTSKGYLGLGPAAMEVNDHVCVVLGCGKPLAMRPSTQEIESYQIVGQCFVPELMDKEALLGRLSLYVRRKVIASNVGFRFTYLVNDVWTLEDPRLGPYLPPGWAMQELSPSGRGQQPALILFVKGSKSTPYDPRLSREELIKRDVKVKTLTLV